MEAWSASRELPEHWFGPSIGLGFDGSGRALAGYGQVVSRSPLATRFAIADLRAAGQWVDGFELLSTEGDIPVDIAVAVGADRAAAACITSRASADPTATMRHRVLYRPAGSRAWEDPVEIVGGSEAASGVEVRVAPNGLAVVIAARADGPAGDEQIGSVMLAAHPANGGWTAPQLVSTPGHHADSPRLGLDGVGNATIAWIHRRRGAPVVLDSVRVVTREASTGTLSQPVALTTETELARAFTVFLDVHPNGAAVLATQRLSTGQFQIQAGVTTRPSAGGAWQPMTALHFDSTASTSGPRAVGIAADGTAYVLLWRQAQVSDESAVQITRCLPGAAWEAPRNFSVPNMDNSDGAIAFRGNDVVAVYTGAIGSAPGAGVDGIRVFQAGVWRAGAAQPEAPVDLAPQGRLHSLRQALADKAGSIVVTDFLFEGETPHTFLTALDPTLALASTLPRPEAVTAVAFSPDGARLATAAGPTARVVDLATGQQVREVVHGATVNALVYASDGLAVATCSDDKTAQLTEIATGNQLLQVTHGDVVVDLALSTNGRRMATASLDGTARVATVGAGTRTLSHDDVLHAVAITADGTRVATGCADGRARVFGADSGLERFAFDQGGSVDGVRFSPDGALLATCGSDGTARLYDAVGGVALSTLPHEGRVREVAFDRDGARLATASDDCTCRIVATSTGSVALTLGHPTAVTSVAFSAHGNRIATVTTEDIVYVYDGAGARLARLRNPAQVGMVAFRPDGSLLAVACRDKQVPVYSLT